MLQKARERIQHIEEGIGSAFSDRNIRNLFLAQAVSEILFESFGSTERVLKVLKSSEDYGGPQSVEDVCINLNMKHKNAASTLSRLSKKGKIERIERGIYRIRGDTRPYKENKPHYKQ